MQCPNFGPIETLLEIITFLLMLLIVTGIVYLLIRKFNKSIKLATFLKAILLYYLCAVILYLIREVFIFSFYFKILKFLVFGAVLFITFRFITKKVFLIGWKESLAIFLLMVFILLPLLNYFRAQFEFKILTSPFFEKRETQWEPINIQTILYCSSHLPLHVKIIGDIEGGITSWVEDDLREIIASWPKD